MFTFLRAQVLILLDATIRTADPAGPIRSRRAALIYWLAVAVVLGAGLAWLATQPPTFGDFGLIETAHPLP